MANWMEIARRKGGRGDCIRSFCFACHTAAKACVEVCLEKFDPADVKKFSHFSRPVREPRDGRLVPRGMLLVASELRTVIVFALVPPLDQHSLAPISILPMSQERRKIPRCIDSLSSVLGTTWKEVHISINRISSKLDVRLSRVE
jgi:hypothetical protein